MVPPHVLKVPLACLSTVRLIPANSSDFQRHATRRSSCALHEYEHRPARRLQQKDRFNRSLLLCSLGVGYARAVTSVSQLLQREYALLDTPKVGLLAAFRSPRSRN